MNKKYSYDEFLIKKKNGKERKIVSPNEALLKYQQDKIPKLEKIFNKKIKQLNIEDLFHGFVKNKNCVTAAEKHIGFESTVTIDLSNFFDTVNRDMFNYKIIDDNNLFHKDGYCAQGFATSPMLCNIAIVEMMQSIDMYLDSMLEDYAFTIYADDITISTNMNSSEAIKIYIIDKIYKIINNYNFEVNKNKTRIRYAKYGYRKILGINVGDKEIRPTRKTIRKIRAAIKQENIKSLQGLSEWAKCNRPKK